jgi:DNA repair protein SbcD/Mre11
MRCLRRDQERTLRRFSESFNEVQASLGAFKNDKTLKCFAELEIIEKDRDPALTVNLHKFITEFQSDEVDILNYKFKFTNTASGLQLDGDSRNIEDLTPKEILIKKLETEEVEEDKKNLIIEAFDELLNEIVEKG